MPRAGLTADLVVAHAGELVDREGYDALTLATLAGELGIKVPSLYKHVTSLADLQRRLRLAGLRELDENLRNAAVGRAGTDALLAIGHAYRRYAHEHPGHYAAGLRAPDPTDGEEVAPVAARLVELMLAVVRGYGLHGDDALHAVRGVRAALHGFVALEHAGGFGMPYDVETSFEHLLTTLDRGLQHHADVSINTTPASTHTT
jgi:AcrR family transcriptional regulator